MLGSIALALLLVELAPLTLGLGKACWGGGIGGTRGFFGLEVLLPALNGLLFSDNDLCFAMLR